MVLKEDSKKHGAVLTCYKDGWRPGTYAASAQWASGMLLRLATKKTYSLVASTDANPADHKKPQCQESETITKHALQVYAGHCSSICTCSPVSSIRRTAASRLKMGTKDFQCIGQLLFHVDLTFGVATPLQEHRADGIQIN
jgi:hypothetical protein